MFKLNVQRGFGALVIILLLAVLGVAGVAAYSAYRQSSNSSANNEQAVYEVLDSQGAICTASFPPECGEGYIKVKAENGSTKQFVLKGDPAAEARTIEGKITTLDEVLKKGSLVSIFTQPDGKTVKLVHAAAIPLQ